MISVLALHIIAWLSWLVHHSSPSRRAGARIRDVNHYIWLFYMSFRNLTQVAGVTRQVPLLAEPYRQPHLLFDTQSLTSLEHTEVRQAWLPRSTRNPPPQSCGDACNHNYLFLHAPGEYMAALDLQGKHITKLLHHHHPQSWFLTRIEVCHINKYQDIFQFFSWQNRLLSHFSEPLSSPLVPGFVHLSLIDAWNQTVLCPVPAASLPFTC